MKSVKTKTLRTIIIITMMLLILISAKYMVNLIRNVNAIIKAPTRSAFETMSKTHDDSTLEALRKTYQFADSLIQTEKGVITIKRDVEYQEFTYTTKGYSFFLFSIQTILFIFIFSILLTAYKLFKSALRGENFTSINVKRIRRIALLLSGYVIFIIISGLFQNSILRLLFNSAQHRPDVEINFESIFPLLFLLLVILGLLEFFKAGIALKEDNKLTI